MGEQALTPTLLLDRLHRGERLGEILKAAGKPPSLVERWRREDPDFERDFQFAMAPTRGSTPDSPRRPPGDKDENSPLFGWKQLFLATYEEMPTAPIAEVCRRLRELGTPLRPGLVYRSTSPRRAAYDATFAARVTEIRGEFVAEIEETFERDLRDPGNATLRQRFLERGPLTTDRYLVPKRLEVSGTVDHQHSLAPALAERVARTRSDLVAAERKQLEAEVVRDADNGSAGAHDGPAEGLVGSGPEASAEAAEEGQGQEEGRA